MFLIALDVYSKFSGSSFSLSDGNGNFGTYIGGNTTVSKVRLVLLLAQCGSYRQRRNFYSGYKFFGCDFYKKGDVNVEEIFNPVLRQLSPAQCSSFDGDGLTNGSYSQGKRLDPNCDHYAVGGSGGGLYTVRSMAS